MSKLLDSFEKGFAVFVIALIFVQLLALFAKDVLKLEVPSFLLQLGIVFTFLAIGAVVVMIWTIPNYKRKEGTSNLRTTSTSESYL